MTLAHSIMPGSRPRRRDVGLHLWIDRTLYVVKRICCDQTAALRAFRLIKPDGTCYDVAQTRFGPECDCPDFIFRRSGLDPDGCKHVQALTAYGMLDDAERVIATNRSASMEFSRRRCQGACDSDSREFWHQ